MLIILRNNNKRSYRASFNEPDSSRSKHETTSRTVIVSLLHQEKKNFHDYVLIKPFTIGKYAARLSVPER